MNRPMYLNQIRKRIETAEPGMVFIPSDFFDIVEPVKVNVCLSRLATRGELTRVKRGVYAKPRRSDWLETDIPPRSDDIAHAVARRYGWTIVPCGDTALNQLGLSTQMPVVHLYVSDGPYHEINADGLSLRFKHTDNKNEIKGVSYQTALVVQALKALGKNNVTEKEIRLLAGNLSRNDKRRILGEGRQVTAWIYKIIRKISEGVQDEPDCHYEEQRA